MADVRLNIQGLARRDKDFQSCILPEPGHITVSLDLSSGEPTVTSHYSQDVNYKYACFDGVGKEPYYAKDGTLMISDVYLMTMSRSPVGNIIMRDAFHNTYGGNTFTEQWLVDDEVIKNEIKDSRSLHKMLCMSGCTLVAVKNRGLVAISEVRSGDVVWDGEEWVQTDGAIEKGSKEVISLCKDLMTNDHKVLTQTGWREAGKTLHTEVRYLDAPDYSWADVWEMVRNVGRNTDARRLPINLCRLWLRRGMEKLRQLTQR